jgi:serine/threonine protein kinase
MLQAGDIITLERGSYRLREQLAGSAYGVVWAATGPGGTGAALKLINRAQMEQAAPALQERWVASAGKEIAFLGSLAPWDERHIVRLLDAGRHDGLPVMALELMDTDLARHLAAVRERSGAIALPQILAWMGQVNQALSKVHQYGWLYLDLKPANVLMYSAGGAVKLADFGTSRLRAEVPGAQYAGTASWQAPEQFFPGARKTYELDTRTDYFALGAMFYYLVTGGVQLRFCSDCGTAYREHRAGAAAALLARHGGAIPTTLHDDEAGLFAHRIGNPAGASGDATWCPAGDGAAASAALSLLRALLEQDRRARPQHGVQISRMLAAVGDAMRPPGSVQARRLPAHHASIGLAV